MQRTASRSGTSNSTPQEQAVCIPKSVSMRISSWGFLRIWFIDEGYLWDWSAAVILVIINLVVPLQAIKPVDRFYLPTDATLSYPAPSSSTIPGSLMYVLAFLFPAVVICGTALFRKSFHDGHHGLLSLLESFALATTWKRWMNILGVYRPIWLAALAGGNQSDIDDARLSYPSGHSAYMFCGCAVLTLYLLGKFKVMSQPGKAQFVLALVSLIPVVLATFVSMTRVYDYKHAPADVNAGCFIGLASAVFAYMLNFYFVTDVNSALPRGRTWSTHRMSAVVMVVPEPQPPLPEACSLTA